MSSDVEQRLNRSLQIQIELAESCLWLTVWFDFHFFMTEKHSQSNGNMWKVLIKSWGNVSGGGAKDDLQTLPWCPGHADSVTTVTEHRACTDESQQTQVHSSAEQSQPAETWLLKINFQDKQSHVYRLMSQWRDKHQTSNGDMTTQWI